ncbi:MAG: hypothetical protein ACYC7A_17665 [Thermoanaerobaculia bacterium]
MEHSEEQWTGGKYPASGDRGLGLSEFANDTIPSGRGTSVPPQDTSGRMHKLDDARERALEIAHDYRDYIAIAGGILVGVVAAQLLLRASERERETLRLLD